MKLKMSLVTAAIALTAVIGVSSALAAHKTSVTITGNNGDYYGYVHSPKHSCELNRTVKVYKVKHGVATKIGQDIAEPNGPDSMWSIGNSGFKHGHFYAKVKARGNCSGAKSKTIDR